MSSAVILVLFPLVGAGLALLGKLLRPAGLFSVLAVLPLAGMAAGLALQLPGVLAGEVSRYALGGWPEPQGIALVLDGMAWLQSALIVGISLFVAVAAFAGGHVDPKKRYGPSFYFFFMILISGMEAVALTGDIFTMFVAFEVVAVAAYVLIAYDQTDAGLLASLKYLILSSVGILFFLFGVFLIYREIGTLSLAAIQERLAAGAVGGPGGGTGAGAATNETTLRLAVVALCVGIGVRTAFIPFHTWLPEAHAYAPHPVSALLSGVLIKVSFFAMLRIISVFSAAYFADLLLWIGAITAVFAVFWALAQSDAKRLLAYHSISQMGYVLAAFGAATALSLPAAFAHAINHALFKSLLFIAVGTAIGMTGERDVYHMRPIGRRAPLLALALLVGALSIAGIPPFNGFASKQFVSAAVYGSPAYVLLWVTAVGTTASFMKLLRIARPWGGKASAGGAAPGTAGQADIRRPGRLIHVATLGLSLASLAAGIFGRQLLSLYRRLLSVTPRDGGGAADMPQLYSLSALSDSALILGLGIALYFLVMTAPGKRVSTAVRSLTPQLGTILLFFFVGLGLFSVIALLG